VGEGFTGSPATPPLSNSRQPNQTWYDCQIKICGEKNNAKVSKRYQSHLPGDSPELLSLDCHLFADMQEGAAKNVALTYHIDKRHEDWAKKYSLATPAKVYNALQHTIATGCSSAPLCIAQDVKRIFEETLGRIVEAQGCYIEESSGRIAQSGVRAEAAVNFKRETMPVDASVLTSFHKMVKKMTSGGGVSFVFDDKNDLAKVCHDTLNMIAVSDDDNDFDGNEDNNEINEVEELFYDPDGRVILAVRTVILAIQMKTLYLIMLYLRMLIFPPFAHAVFNYTSIHVCITYRIWSFENG
jgi:hypothetical protein